MRPPRATWPPAYAFDKPSADASAEAFTTTVGMVGASPPAGVFWAWAALLASRKAARANGVGTRWKAGMVLFDNNENDYHYIPALRRV